MRDPAAAVVAAPDAFGVTLLAWSLDRLGPDSLAWHPAAVRAACRDALGADLPAANFDRLMAARLVLTTDLFWRKAWAFVRAANVLSGSPLDPAAFDPADAHETAWAVTEAVMIDPPGPDEEGFSPEVRRYIAHALTEEGYLFPPAVLAGLPEFAPDAPDDLFPDADDLRAAARAGAEARRAELDRFLADGVARAHAQLAKVFPGRLG